MVFVPPSWIWGAFMYGIIYLIPVVVGFACIFLGADARGNDDFFEFWNLIDIIEFKICF